VEPTPSFSTDRPGTLALALDLDLPRPPRCSAFQPARPCRPARRRGGRSSHSGLSAVLSSALRRGRREASRALALAAAGDRTTPGELGGAGGRQRQAIVTDGPFTGVITEDFVGSARPGARDVASERLLTAARAATAPAPYRGGLDRPAEMGAVRGDHASTISPSQAVWSLLELGRPSEAESLFHRWFLKGDRRLAAALGPADPSRPAALGAAAACCAALVVGARIDACPSTRFMWITERFEHAGVRDAAPVLVEALADGLARRARSGAAGAAGSSSSLDGASRAALADAAVTALGDRPATSVSARAWTSLATLALGGGAGRARQALAWLGNAGAATSGNRESRSSPGDRVRHAVAHDAALTALASSGLAGPAELWAWLGALRGRGVVPSPGCLEACLAATCLADGEGGAQARVALALARSLSASIQAFRVRDGGITVLPARPAAGTAEALLDLAAARGDAGLADAAWELLWLARHVPSLATTCRVEMLVLLSAGYGDDADGHADVVPRQGVRLDTRRGNADAVARVAALARASDEAAAGADALRTAVAEELQREGDEAAHGGGRGVMLPDKGLGQWAPGEAERASRVRATLATTPCRVAGVLGSADPLEMAGLVDHDDGSISSIAAVLPELAFDPLATLEAPHADPAAPTTWHTALFSRAPRGVEDESASARLEWSARVRAEMGEEKIAPLWVARAPRRDGGRVGARRGAERRSLPRETADDGGTTRAPGLGAGGRATPARQPSEPLSERPDLPSTVPALLAQSHRVSRGARGRGGDDGGRVASLAPVRRA